MTGCEIIERINHYHDRASRRGLSFNMAVNDRLTAAIDRFGYRGKLFLGFSICLRIAGRTIL